MKNRLLKRIAVRAVIRLGALYNKHLHVISTRTLPVFEGNPKNLTIELPRKVTNPERMFIGSNVSMGPGCMLVAMTHYPTIWMQSPDREIETQHFDSRIVIGDNVTATERLQIISCTEVIIGNDVMFASNVHINDSMHSYDRADLPYKYQPLKVAPIHIGQGCWIGQNVVVMPGVEIGEFSIIGANSVVNRSIPARSIVAGSPARIIKEWDDESQSWIRYRGKNSIGTGTS